jgi:hypothetical protein
VVRVVDGDQHEVAVEEVDVLGPARHQLVPGVQVARVGGEARVELAVEGVHAGLPLL